MRKLELNQMEKLIKPLITLVLLLIVTYSCNNPDELIEANKEKINYKSFKVDNFTAGEIGKLHNAVLQSLKEKRKIKGSKEELILALQNAEIDARISKNEILNATNNLYQMKSFQEAINSPLSKRKSVENFQEEVLSFLVSKNEISIEAKNEINNLSTLSIPAMKSKTEELLMLNLYSLKEKKYFAVYTNVYENSNEFWNPNNTTSRWQPYAADAIGGLLGLYGGPAWSIIQGALLSAAFD